MIIRVTSMPVNTMISPTRTTFGFLARKYISRPITITSGARYIERFMVTKVPQSPSGYKTIKVPVWVYENAHLVRSDIVRRGLDALPAHLREHLELTLSGTDHRSLGIGQILGLGLIELRRILEKQ